MNRLPNFLYIGTSKAGSTWLYSVLSAHPDVYMAPGKGLYFFDNKYDEGADWYREQFAGAGHESVVGEISHSYMYCPQASDRIAELRRDMRLMVCLREPAQRAFSAYLDGVKNGQFQGSFEQELEQIDSLLERGNYARYLEPFVNRFGRERIHVGIFDRLGAEPGQFIEEVYRFLEIEPLELAAPQTKKMMPAGRPRSKGLVKLAKQMSRAAKTVGLRSIRGRVKRSRLVRNSLYRPYGSNDKPVMSPATNQRLRDHFRQDVIDLDALLGTSLQQTWGYQ